MVSGVVPNSFSRRRTQTMLVAPVGVPEVAAGVEGEALRLDTPRVTRFACSVAARSLDSAARFQWVERRPILANAVGPKARAN